MPERLPRSGHLADVHLKPKGYALCCVLRAGLPLHLLFFDNLIGPALLHLISERHGRLIGALGVFLTPQERIRRVPES